MSSRITAFLDMNISGFTAGVARAGTLMERLKRTVKIGDLGGGVRSLLGGGAILQGFRATINAAQEARDRARELGRTVDAGTASVARYGDAWNGIKASISSTAIAGLGLVTRLGEYVGEFVNDNIAGRFRGLGFGFAGSNNAERVRRISEEAGENADRLSSPAARDAARRRGEDRARAAADARRKDDQELGRVQAELAAAEEERRTAAEAQLPLAEQIGALETRRTAQLRTYNDTSKSALDRAKAFRGAVASELQIAERKRTLEAQAAAEKARAEEAELARREAIAPAQERQATAQERVQTATAELARQRDDARKFSPEDLVKTASGRRDTTATGLRAAQILRDEARARTLERSRGSETLFDARTQRNVRADARFFQSRALTARSKFGQLRSDERDPFAGAGKELTGAAAELKQAAAELKTVQVTVDAS